jgi:flavin-dependent dehydrogenase
VKRYDVAILGGGIAGAFLARHIRRARPELSILLLEASSKIDNLKVGESTVEVAAHYMIKRLGLSTYLYQHQLPKNGLRFFFDTKEKDLPLEQMSEIGSDHMPYHPSFQLERARLERDILEMNAADGVDVQLGAKVTDLEVKARGAGDHQVTYERDGEKYEIACRFVYDASGRRHLLHRKLGNKIHKETRLNTGAAWARYRNVAGLDASTDPEFRARVRYTSRHLSTNHIMGDGYWIWFIPLAGDLMSVGAVFDKDRIAELGIEPAKTRESLERFVMQHRAGRDLMEGAVFEDFQAYAHLPYHSDTFFSADRWAVTGEAGAFVDPFYSPGSDFIATANELIVAQLCADLDGEADLNERVDASNAFYRLKYEATTRLYIQQYKIFGSYSIFRLKYLLDFNNYYNLVTWPFMADKLRDLSWLKEELKFADLQVRAIGAMGEHFAKLADLKFERGDYYAQNKGHWANGLNGVAQLQEKLGPVVDDKFRREQIDRSFGSVFAAILEQTEQVAGLCTKQRVLDELKMPVVLALKDLQKDALNRLLPRLAAKLARDLKVEFPDVEGVTFERAQDGSLTPQVQCTTSEKCRVAKRANDLWNTRGESLAEIRL